MNKLVLSTTLLMLLTLGVCGQQKMENLVIVWPEEYKWKAVSNQEDGAVHMMELVPGNETADKWTIIGTMMSVKGAKNVPMDVVMNSMADQAKQKAPKATVTLVEKDEASTTKWILFKIESPEFSDDKNPESQLYFVIQGETSLYINFVAVKEKTLSAAFVDKWKGIFKKSELVSK